MRFASDILYDKEDFCAQHFIPEMQVNGNKHILSCLRKRTYTYTHTHTRTRIQTHTHTDIHTHTHTHTHLFTVMINDLPSVTTNSKIMMYADDTVLFYSAKKVDEIESSLNEDLRHVNNWVNTNGLSLNPIKTQFMIFGTPQKLSSITEPMCLKLENHSLTQVSTYKYLGVYLDPSLKWKDHIYHSSKKIGSRLALLSRLKRTLPLQSLKLLANSLVLPLFDYCSVAWSVLIN